MDVTGYQKDSASLTVTAQNSVFADKELNLIPNFNAPQIMSYSPADSSSEVSNLSPIKIEFDIKMDVVSVQSAFSITPPVAGTFSWAKNDMELSFIPNTSFTAGATYTVIVSAAAKTFFHIALDQPLSFSFTTRAKLNLVDHYPFNNEEDVSKTVVVKLFFDFAIESASLPGNILFYDKDNKFVSLAVNQSAYSKGMIEFEPNVPLKAGEYYRVILKPGIGDIEKVKLQEDREITFRVENTNYSGGNVLFDFESLTGIIAPQANVFSKGIDTENTSLVITGTKKVDGSSSALLDYKFISDTAEVFIDFQTPKEFAVGAGTEFGVWVFGDLSKNLIKYHLINSQNESFFIDVDTLDFTGWKFKSIKISDSGISGTVKFKGIVISKSSAGSNVGSIFFDNAQYDFTTPVSYERPIEKIYAYSLVGNYPNPFNPSTKIKFTIPETADVSLVVFNLLGEEVVSILKDEKFNAGEYTVDWNAANNKGAKVPSGVYFYELRTEKFRAVKKMLLIR
ncbi:MAG: Ig-like domain-containing protein [Bacteroidetes bacterium]|nr:Ig-like domain-containing protein [Bacteroidota bacterium]